MLLNELQSHRKEKIRRKDIRESQRKEKGGRVIVL